MKTESALQATSSDYLSNASAAAYFAAREHEVFYRSLKTVDERREFHDELKSCLQHFLRVADDQAMPVLDDIIGRAARLAQAGSQSEGTAIERAQLLEPRGIELLRVGPDPDFDAMRSAYRRAALEHHPDRGGSNADMSAINHAYELLHAMLADTLEVERAELGEFWVGPRTGRDYVYAATCLLFDVALDDWALDDALALLERVSGDLLTETTLAVDDQRITLIYSAAKLAERLAAANLGEMARRSLEIAHDGLEAAKRQGLLYDGYLSQAEDVVKGRRNARFILKHERQIDNAYRLGAINEERYAANLARVQGKATRLDAAREARRALLAETEFVRSLPADASVQVEGAPPAHLVPQPDYYQVRAETLSLDQQAEYTRAFAAPHELELIEKYAFVRLSSLLRSAIFSPGVVEPEQLADEVHRLGLLQPKLDWYGTKVEQILRVFSGLDLPEQNAYAKELAELLEPQATKIGDATVTIMIGGLAMGSYEFAPDFLEHAVTAGNRRMK